MSNDTPGVKLMDSLNGVEVVKTSAVTGLSAYTISVSANDLVVYLTIILLLMQISSIAYKWYKENKKV